MCVLVIVNFGCAIRRGRFPLIPAAPHRADHGLELRVSTASILVLSRALFPSFASDPPAATVASLCPASPAWPLLGRPGAGPLGQVPGLGPAWAGTRPAASATLPAWEPSLGRPKAGAFGLVPGLAGLRPACQGLFFPFSNKNRF